MPGFSFGLPVAACIIGSKLKETQNSVCSHCYAFRGSYVYNVVKRAQQRRLTNLNHPLWTEAIVILLQHKIDKSKKSYVRLHA
jgi:hypothetical protein